MSDTPTPSRIPLSKILWNSESAPVGLVDAKEYDKVCSELTAAREEIANLKFICKCESESSIEAHDILKAVTEQLDEARDTIAWLTGRLEAHDEAMEQRDRLADALEITRDRLSFYSPSDDCIDMATEALQSLNQTSS